MRTVCVRLPKASRAYGHFPDSHAAMAALRLAERVGADEITVQAMDETQARHYTLDEVRALLRKQPELASLSGLGRVEPIPGVVVNTGGSHVVLPGFRFSSGGILLPRNPR